MNVIHQTYLDTNVAGETSPPPNKYEEQMDQGASSKESKLIQVHFSREEGISIPIGQEEFADRPVHVSFRNFGINE